jgi:hypothetical protein
MRAPSAAAASSSVPLRVIVCTFAVSASMKVEMPGVAEKATVVVDRKVSGPAVRSRRTSYDVTEMSD